MQACGHAMHVACLVMKQQTVGERLYTKDGQNEAALLGALQRSHRKPRRKSCFRPKQVVALLYPDKSYSAIALYS